MPTVFANRQPPTASGQRPTAHDPALIAHLTQELNDALNVHLAPTFAHLGDDWAEQIRPFHWVVAFPELFVDEAGQPLAAQAGFARILCPV